MTLIFRQPSQSLARVINRAVENRGVVLIPAFSIGRTQELLYEIEELLHRDKIEDIEVIVDSPLAAQFSAIYHRLKKYDINAEVHTISGYSAHADQRNLVNFIKRMRHKPNDIRLVHGDAEAKASLAAVIKDQLAISSVTAP